MPNYGVLVEPGLHFDFKRYVLSVIIVAVLVIKEGRQLNISLAESAVQTQQKVLGVQASLVGLLAAIAMHD